MTSSEIIIITVHVTRVYRYRSFCESFPDMIGNNVKPIKHGTVGFLTKRVWFHGQHSSNGMRREEEAILRLGKKADQARYVDGDAKRKAKRL